jgi:hypothetical protein
MRVIAFDQRNSSPRSKRSYSFALRERFCVPFNRENQHSHHTGRGYKAATTRDDPIEIMPNKSCSGSLSGSAKCVRNSHRQCADIARRHGHFGAFTSGNQRGLKTAAARPVMLIRSPSNSGP